MSIGTAFFICAFGGILLGGAIGEVIERVKAKKKAQALKLRQNQIETFWSCAAYNPQEAIEGAGANRLQGRDEETR